ncbi:STAS domain-containing protein [Nonomuraea basaltis]|uniref:STAS domain-containing protein n=1 Tax=Nonomuraea basaltis TaxID=2495887 RepID=UPI00110C57A0|nr:STAS domain-containing protein [Nonomuraea basaltis]TMR98745.1 STAS domain-containing protein [Nonomuraea basaltis]
MGGLEERLLYQDEQLKITVRSADGAPAVTLIGEIDATNSSALALVLASCRQDAYITVDTGALTFIDVSGLRVLVMPTLPPSQRWIRLHNVTPYQRRLLRMMGWYYEPRAHHLPL